MVLMHPSFNLISLVFCVIFLLRIIDSASSILRFSHVENLGILCKIWKKSSVKIFYILINKYFKHHVVYYPSKYFLFNCLGSKAVQYRRKVRLHTQNS